MSFPHLIGYSVLTLAVWKLVRRRASRKANALDVAGPETEHWWKGWVSLAFSNMESVFMDSFEYCLKIAAHYGGAVKIHAMFGEEWLFVSDPRALHHMLVKEQHIFEENDNFILLVSSIVRTSLIDPSQVPTSSSLARVLFLNPVFSISNMRELLPIIQNISHQLKSILVSNLPTHHPTELDELPWLSRSSLDCICEGVLGYHSAALDTGKENEYTEALRMLGLSISKTILFRPIVPVVMRNFSLYWCKKIADWLTISWLPTQTMKDLRELRRIVEVMDSASRNILQEKKAALAMPSPMPSQSHDTSGGTRGKDIMSIMLRANASSTEGDRLSDAELLGQMNVMIFAGLETTSAAVARALYMLAKHPHVQQQLRAEICDAATAHQAVDVDHSHAKDGSGSVRLSYDSLMNLPFLDAVVRETLRLYPSLPVLGRRMTSAASVPLQFPVRSLSGEEINTISVAKHQAIVISIIAANHNQAVWGEDASEWKPERWLNSTQGQLLCVQKRKSLIKILLDGVKDGVKYTGVYSSMMTFLAGNRSCMHDVDLLSLNLGLKFAEMEIKDVLATLVPDIHFALPSEPDENGHVKEIYWKMTSFHTPVVKAPAGDGETPHLPLSLRLVRE
ncbi:cytochrome P450 [Suillus americanus]|nr:cytochrome P450 [Suillus americanus]